MPIETKMITSWKHILKCQDGYTTVIAEGNVGGGTVTLTVSEASRGYGMGETHGSSSVAVITIEDWKDLVKEIEKSRSPDPEPVQRGKGKITMAG